MVIMNLYILVKVSLIFCLNNNFLSSSKEYLVCKLCNGRY